MNNSTKINIVFTLFFAISLNCISQKPVDDFMTILNSTQDEYLKLNTLDSITHILSKTDELSSIPYEVQFIDLALELKEYDKAAMSAIRVFYPYKYLKNDSEKSLAQLNKVLPYIDSISITKYKGGLYVKKAGAYFDSDTKKAIKNYDLAVKNYSDKDSIDIADAIYFKAQAHTMLGSYVDAIKSYKESYTYYENLNDTSYMLNVKNNMASLYNELNLTNEAQKTLNSVKEILKTTDDSNALINSMFEEANIFRIKKDFSKEEKKILQIDSILNTLDVKSQKYNFLKTNVILTKLYADRGDVKNATYYFNNLEKDIEYITNSEYTHLIYLNAKIKYLNLIGKHQQALESAKFMLKMANKINNFHEIQFAEGHLVDTYQKLNQQAKAFPHLLKMKELKDSIFNAQSTNSLLYFQSLFQTEENEKNLLVKQNEIELLEQSEKYTKRISIFGFVGLGLLSLALFLWVKRKSLLKEKKLQEDFTSELLNFQEQEKKRVSENLHDGLGQSLLLIKNKIVLNNDIETQKILDSVINEVHTISHGLHPFQLEELGLTEAIKSIIEQVSDNSETFISSDIEDINGIFTKKQELNIYRTVQESLNNMMKHSKAEACRVEIEKQKSKVKISIIDNGVGFDFTEEYSKIGSLGLKTLKERVRFLDGIMSFNSEKNKGTEMFITIPI
ncbi:ATP-binding protein [Urechidicola croceus]|uniref:histidine kinase n=1 Tax=Urechidicola croceus TaxID=1850246 RepID=A0A1D8PA79_9FLAO|nr:ATP-binding protein [Urechidicola croceus]AOW21436.1 hypothetical protein LPB138_12425 [Urechidicola croceus]